MEEIEKVLSETVSENKEVLGDVEINRRVFKRYLEALSVPDSVNIKIIDISLASENYFKKAEELAENDSNKIIVANSFSTVFVKKIFSEERVENLFNKSNVALLMVPFGFHEIEEAMNKLLEKQSD